MLGEQAQIGVPDLVSDGPDIHKRNKWVLTRLIERRKFVVPICLQK